MRPDVVVVGSTCLAVSGIYNVAVVHFAVTVVVELREVELWIVLASQLKRLTHHVARIGVGALCVAGVAAIISCWLRQCVWSNDLEVWDELSHRVVAVIIFHAARTAVGVISRLVQPTCKVVVGVTHGAVSEVDEYHEILRLLHLRVLTLDFAWSHNLTVERLCWCLAHDVGAFKEVGVHGLCCHKVSHDLTFRSVTFVDVVCALLCGNALTGLHVVVDIAEESFAVFLQHESVGCGYKMIVLVALYPYEQRCAVGLFHHDGPWVCSDGISAMHTAHCDGRSQQQSFETLHKCSF